MFSSVDKQSILFMAPGANKRIERESRQRDEWHRNHSNKQPEQAVWSKFEGSDVLRIKECDHLAVPLNGRNSQYFGILDISDRSDYVCILKRDEVQSWLYRKYSQ
jgi:hypothetical protein